MAVDAIDGKDGKTAKAKKAAEDKVKALQQKIDDLSALVKGKGKGKNKGKNDGYGKPGAKAAPKTPCPICGKNHWKADCWYNPDRKPVTTGKGAWKGTPPVKQEGKASGGGGKGAGKGPGCWSCGQTGHIAAKCPNNPQKKISAIEDTKEVPVVDSLSGIIMMNSVLINSVADEHPELVQHSYKILTGVDSGAAVSVWTEKTATDYPVVSDEHTGRSYKVASGAQIKDQGCRKIAAVSNGVLRGAQGRVAAVHKNLTAVFDMMAAGHRVVFDLDEQGNDISHALHKASGTETRFIPNGRTWDMELHVVPYTEARKLPRNNTTTSTSTTSSSTTPLGLYPFSRPPHRV